MQIIVAKNYEEMSRIAADMISRCVKDMPECVLGLATGSTPIGTYKCLVDDYKNGKIDFSGVTTFNLDEYAGLPGENNQSYRYFMNDNLFNHVNIDAAATHIPDGMTSNPQQMCEDYDEAIIDAGGIDLQLLGIGHNGHIGFNEPAPDFPVGTHVVDLTESTINANSRLFDSIDDVPRQAFTMGIGTIMCARSVLVVASGADKADIVARAFTGPVCPDVPASVLQLHPDATVICDAEAAAKL